MMLSARDITVRAGRAELLRNVSIEAVPGEVVGLIGPNGAGKSTLMRVLAGVKAPDQGTVLYDGHSAAQMGRRALARRLAFLPQGGGSAWPLSVERLVALGRVPHRGPFGAPDLPGAQAIEQSLAAMVQAGVATYDDAMAASVHPDEIAGLAQHGEANPAMGAMPAQFVVGAGTTGSPGPQG